MAFPVRGLSALVLLLLPAIAAAQGGPPMVVDDPDTPGPGYWEVNLGTVFERSPTERRLEAPLADINYGVGERIQLKFEMPWVTITPAGAAIETGAGNVLLGVKWRFLGQEERRIAWSIYPQVEVNTGAALVRDAVVDRGVHLFLPTELTLRVGFLELNGEIGRNFATSGGGYSIYGASTEVEIRRFELLAEVRAQQRNEPSRADVGYDVGGRGQLTNQLTLLAAVGTSFHGPDDRAHLRVYLGLQFNLPHQFGLDP